MGLSLLLTGIPSVYFLKPEWLSPVLVTISWQNPVQRTVKILVAEFEGPQAQNYRVTDTLLNKIREQTTGYKDVQVVPLGKAITEREGKDVARQVGKEKQADIVIWGWYGKTKDKVPLSVHFELLTKPNELPELGVETQGKVRSLSVATLESFEMQVDLAQEITYLSLVTLGISRYSVDDWDGTIVRLSAALESVKILPKALDPAAIYFYRANAYYNKGEKDWAIADFSKALKLNPNLAEVYNNRGAAYRKKGEYDQAIEDFNQTLKLNPNLADAYNNRGVAYRKKGENDRAILDYNQALKLNPNSAEAYINRGAAYGVKGEYDWAIDDFNQALKLNPNYAQAYNNRGFAYFFKGEYDRVIDDFNQALKLNPNYAEAYGGRGLIYRFKGDNQKAIADFQTCLKLAQTPQLKQLAQQQLVELGVK